MNSNIAILHYIPNFQFKHYQQLIASNIDLGLFISQPHKFATMLRLSETTIDFITHANYQPYLKKIDQWLKSSSNHQLICFDDEAYPPQLKQISDPPLALYCIGDINLLQTLQLAVVGTRKLSHYGIKVVDALLPKLIDLKLTITSGMALGIDTLVHQKALALQSKTIAVLGTGVDICYPNQNRNLYQQIQQNGLIISEFLLGQAPKRYHFPQRNRVISGLSLGVLVIEAAEKSGSLITAMHALEQNREVFAIPGNIFHTESQGCNKLIQMGAKLVWNALDIATELNLPQQFTLKQPFYQQSLLLNECQQRVFDAIGSACTTIDKIIENTNLTYAEITGILFELEMEALICAVPGGYQRI
ncbi:DNA-processing protein DprA [Fastidiosibacter lacustris]|uniref:DNA-processing protein DprA n=1 Tax=Fastidiosibacter lacustris TaxID=2056695 RepID=UPI000E342499|nr:DNA-processing protein DprA [Fastidiosibacter lacustris]